jgi:ribosomal protein L20
MKSFVPKALKYVLLWSPSRDVFQVKAFADMLFDNWEVYYHRKSAEGDWRILWIGKTAAEARKYQSQLNRDLDDPKFGSFLP